MKLAYQTITWGGVVGHPAGVTSVKDLFYLANGSTEQALSEVAAAGYAGVELFDGNLFQYAQEKESFRRLLDSHGLKLVAVYSGANFIYEDIWEDERWKIEQVAALAAEFGVEHLVVGGGAIRATGTKQEDYKRLGDALNEVVGIAKKYDLTASYHPHLGTIVQTPEQLDRLMPLTSINLCPDTAHIVAGGGNVVEVIEKYSDRIKYVHLKDYADGQFLPLGRGRLDFDSILNALKENNYSGWITVELDDYSGQPAEAAIASYKFLQNKL